MIGSPLSQVLVYSQHYDCPDKVESAVLESLLKRAISDDLNVNILHTFAVGKGQVASICSPVELAILIKRIDVAKLMVIAGANPILADSDPSEVAGVIHLLSEYYEFGTNHYITWLLQEHFLFHEISNFIEKVFEVNIFNEDAMICSVRLVDILHMHCSHVEMRKWLKSYFKSMVSVCSLSLMHVEGRHCKLLQVKPIWSL